MEKQLYMIHGASGAGKSTVLATLKTVFDESGVDFNSRFDVLSFSGIMRDVLEEPDPDQIRYKLRDPEAALDCQKQVFSQVFSQKKNVILDMHGVLYYPLTRRWGPGCPKETHADIRSHYDVVGIAVIEPETAKTHSIQCSLDPSRRRDDFPDSEIFIEKEREYSSIAAASLDCRYTVIKNTYVKPGSDEMPGEDAAIELYRFIQLPDLALSFL